MLNWGVLPWYRDDGSSAAFAWVVLRLTKAMTRRTSISSLFSFDKLLRIESPNLEEVLDKLADASYSDAGEIVCDLVKVADYCNIGTLKDRLETIRHVFHLCRSTLGQMRRQKVESNIGEIIGSGYDASFWSEISVVAACIAGYWQLYCRKAPRWLPSILDLTQLGMRSSGW